MRRVADDEVLSAMWAHARRLGSQRVAPDEPSEAVAAARAAELEAFRPDGVADGQARATARTRPGNLRLRRGSVCAPPATSLRACPRRRGWRGGSGRRRGRLHLAMSEREVGDPAALRRLEHLPRRDHESEASRAAVTLVAIGVTLHRKATERRLDLGMARGPGHAEVLVRIEHLQPSVPFTILSAEDARSTHQESVSRPRQGRDVEGL